MGALNGELSQEGSCVQAIQGMHFPNTLEFQEEARQRMAFEELLMLQLTILIRRELNRSAC
jgi:RecG-like helicase